MEKLSLSAQLPVAPEVVENATCLGDWLLMPLLCDSAGGGWQVQKWRNPTAAVKRGAEDVVIADLSEEAVLPFDSAPLEAVYGYDHAAVIPTKVTATQLKGRMVDEELTDSALPTRMRASAFHQPRFMQPQVGLSATERGSAVHTVMEHIDFATPATLEAVEEAIAAMQSRKMLTDLQAEAVDRELVVRFLASPLAQRIRTAEKVYREYRFALLVDAAIYDPSAAGEEMILQGVADCVLVEDGQLVVVDFKTDRVGDGEITARAESYRPQLEAYAHALSQVLEMPVKEKIVYFFHKDSAISL